MHICCGVSNCMLLFWVLHYSLLEQLRAEMQSGTFDLKAAGSYTDTLTLDASNAAMRQQQQHIDSTPAPATKADSRPAATYTATSSRPASAALPGVASCLKTSTAGGAAGIGHPATTEHGVRAVTFAADVHDAATAEEYGKRPAAASTTGVPGLLQCKGVRYVCRNIFAQRSRSLLYTDCYAPILVCKFVQPGRLPVPMCKQTSR